MSNKTLWLFTGGYPFNYGESHIESEIIILSKEFDKIYIVPPVFLVRNSERVIPKNAEVVSLPKDWSSKKGSILIKNLFFILKIFLGELFKTDNKKSFVLHSRELLSMFIQRIYEADMLGKLIEEKGASDSVYYSYWMSDWSTVMGILKHRGLIRSFVSRAHRFDVYEHLNDKQIIPFRQFQLMMIDKVLTDSQKAADFMIETTQYPSKISCSYYGSFDHGINPFKEDDIFRIVSCSALIPRKRVELIIRILAHIEFPIHWVHFGSGELLEDLKKQTLKLPSNVRVEFKGQVTNAEVLEYYGSESINMMLLVSESEGVPMSLVEACSFGIPMLTCNIGGNDEIVNGSTGILVQEQFDPKEVAGLLSEFRSGQKNTQQFRNGVRQFWLDNFNGETNYVEFCRQIKKI